MHLIGPAYLTAGPFIMAGRRWAFLLGLQKEHIKSKMLFERENGRKVAGERSLKPQA